MAAWDSLKAQIAAVIKNNITQDITGDVLQTELFRVVDNVGGGFQYLGTATPATNPGALDGKYFYLTSTEGVYVNMGGIFIDAAGVFAIKYDGSVWTADTVLLLGYDPDTLLKVIRKVNTPYNFSGYVPEGSPYITPLILANTPTKIHIPVTLKSQFQISEVDPGTGSLRYEFTGLQPANLSVQVVTGVDASVANVSYFVMLYKNGNPEPGFRSVDRLRNTAEADNMALLGNFVIQPGDYFELYIECDADAQFTFLNTYLTFHETLGIVTAP